MVKPRQAEATVKFIDEYCEFYRDLFPEVRSYEYLKYLHLGLISEQKRKTLPAIAQVSGKENAQGLDYFFGKSPWSIEEYKKRRIKIILKVLEGEEITVIIDETGDRKKGKKTDYVARQYIGNLGKVENGIVAVTAYGIIREMTIPLLTQVYKPQSRLKEGDEYKSKPEIAVELLKELKELGFKIKRVLADSEYGESQSNFMRYLEQKELEFIVAIRSNHGMWLASDEEVKANQWREFTRVFSTGKTETRFIREIIFGKRREKRYWEITDDKDNLPPNSTVYVMTKIPNVNYQDIGNLYGLRNWIEYGLKQSKNELGWADFRFMEYSKIEKWWELVMSAYLMVSLQSDKIYGIKTSSSDKVQSAQDKVEKHPRWNQGKGWKNTLNNLRLLIQPLCYANLLKPWLGVILNPSLLREFFSVFSQLNRFINSLIQTLFSRNFYLSLP
ncbi:MAG TPA: IS701 family transposase [Kamptonema sp.]|nr:IS701 family transposase [Kamptonema sp.]